jgi:uncharacterized membrane protein
MKSTKGRGQEVDARRARPTTRRRALSASALLCLMVSRLLGCAPDPAGIVAPPSSQGAAGETSAPEPTWCNVRQVLQSKCQRCHRDPPQNGAPFPLMTYEDTQVLDGRGTPRFERMYDAVESDYMPATFLKLEPPVQKLTDDERALLLEWAAAGGKAIGGVECD